MSNTIKTGKDAVVIGDVSGEVGDGSVVIGPTDNHGNTIINTSMAVGRNAKAGPDSIAIGAGASAGTDVFYLIELLRAQPKVSRDSILIANIDDLIRELREPTPNKNSVKAIWPAIQASATVSGAATLVQQIGAMLGV